VRRDRHRDPGSDHLLRCAGDDGELIAMKGTMPSFQVGRSSAEIAARTSCIHNAWGNDASIISVDDVAAAR
jgi:hypothetical protein